MVCVPFTQPKNYSWTVYVKDKMIESYGTLEQMVEYRQPEKLHNTPEGKAHQR